MQTPTWFPPSTACGGAVDAGGEPGDGHLVAEAHRRALRDAHRAGLVGDRPGEDVERAVDDRLPFGGDRILRFLRHARPERSDVGEPVGDAAVVRVRGPRAVCNGLYLLE